ncbi:MAG: YccF domain-containing protein [Solirubrobacterales bacterium]
MRIALSIIWLVFAGLWATILWCIAGIVMCILIITIPFGIQAFKIASFTIWPFGRTLVKRPEAGAASVVGNVIWFVLAGVWLALAHLIASIALAITIIGIPLAMANLKLVMVSLMPFGREIVPIDEVGERQAEGIDFGSL